MIKCQPIIAVANVESSSNWYQQLLGCKGAHGGKEFEMLMDNSGNFFLFLHAWNTHEHPTMSNPAIQAGNGLIIYLTVQDLNGVWQNALKLNAQVEKEPHVSPNSHRKEFSVRDPDGYYLIIST